mgnify:CR=1 FL=1
MSGDVMNNEEDYAFDVAGYLHVPKCFKARRGEGIESGAG